MTLVAVLCAVLALVLLMVLLQARGALSSTRDQLETTDGKLRAALADVKRLEGDLEVAAAKTDEQATELERLEDARSEANSTITHLEDELSSTRDELVDTVEALGTARAEQAAVESTVEVARAELEVREAELAAERDEVLSLTHESESLQVQLAEATDAAARQRTPSVPAVLLTNDDNDLDVPGFSPEMAWQLELVRSERTWRYSVAANPIEDESPFEASDNPLRLAIEIEALALREDVGAFIGIDWQAGTTIDPSSDPARAHLTLRLAQELLASAARELAPSVLVVTNNAERRGVSLEVVASDPDDVDFKIPPPPVASEWIDIDEHGGMVVTVRTGDSTKRTR